MSKRPSPPGLAQPAPKKARQLDATPALAPSLDGWLSSSSSPAPPPLLASSPPLHAFSSTFIAFSLSFVPPKTVHSAEMLKKEAVRAVRALDVVRLVGPELIESEEGAFAHGEGLAPGRRDKPRAREPDHRMWAVRTLALKDGKDGTGGESDYQLLETFDDDGERFGGDRVLRTLKDVAAVDVLTIVCRWFGGDMLGPARFTHIGTVAHTSSKELVALVTRRELRTALVALDEEIAEMRKTIAASKPPEEKDNEHETGQGQTEEKEVKAPAQPANYDDIDDIPRLQRLLRAREMSQKSLERKVGWAAMEQAGGV